MDRFDKACPCGSGLRRRATYDARNIFLTYVCDRCERRRLAGFRPEVLTDPNYSHCEPIEEES
jgi:hypothetical protein